MGFWIFMMFIELLIPVTMIGFGKMFLKHSPKEINMAFGYRTSMSMKNRDTWEFAHKYCGKIWYTSGKILLLLSIISMFFVIGKNREVVENVGGVISIIQLVFLIGSIFPTERALRKTFDKNGRRR